MSNRVIKQTIDFKLQFELIYKLIANNATSSFTIDKFEQAYIKACNTLLSFPEVGQDYSLGQNSPNNIFKTYLICGYRIIYEFDKVSDLIIFHTIKKSRNI